MSTAKTKEKVNNKKNPKIKIQEPIPDGKQLSPEQRKAIKKINNKETAGRATPDLKTEETTKEHFYVGCVIGIKYRIDTSGNKPAPERQVRTSLVWSDKDLANEPAEAEDLMMEAGEQLLKDGYSLTEEDALAQATFTVGCILGKLAHDIEYSDSVPCKTCTRNIIRDVEDLLKLARDFYHRHRDLCMSCECMAGVKVFPNPEDMDDFKFVRGKPYLKNPPDPERYHQGQGSSKGSQGINHQASGRTDQQVIGLVV